MSVLITVGIVLAAMEILSWVADSLEWSDETLPPPNINDVLAEHYKPEPCDIEMRKQCQMLLQRFFEEPEDMPMYQRIDYKMNSLDEKQKKQLLLDIAKEAAVVMNVKIDRFFFEDSTSMGCYNFMDNSIMLSNAYLSIDQCNVEIVKTIFHELKHAVQYDAIGTNGNVWGYSQDTLIAWANNFANYISGSVDPEGYMTQPVEIDGFGFECFVIPKPGMEVQNVNVA